MRLLPLLFAVASLAAAAGAAEPSAAKTIRLMTIGNSFSGNATKYLGEIAEAGGGKIIRGDASVGGAPLELHWGKAQKGEADPKDKAGQYSSGRTLRMILESQTWDYVTIQQASIKSHDLATYQPYATQLRDFIKQYAPTAEILLHETWPYRKDDPRFTAEKAQPGEPRTQAEMYDMLKNAYRTTAKALGVRLLPVGDAFNLANTDAAWGYQPSGESPKSLAFPNLPTQTHSLNKGYAWKKDAKSDQSTLGMDGHHASPAGEYLGGCVWYEVLFGQSVVGNNFRPKEVPEDEVVYLQKIAHRAVEDEKARR